MALNASLIRNVLNYQSLINKIPTRGLRYFPVESIPQLNVSLEERLRELELKGRNLVYEKRVNIGYHSRKQSFLPDKKARIEALSKLKNDQEVKIKSYKQELNIDLDEAQKDWVYEYGPKQIMEIADHYGLYKDLYGHGYFFPLMPMNIAFDYDKEYVTPVYRGNIIIPSEAQKAPSVSFNCEPDDLYSLVLTNLDGHLQDNNYEYLHWFVGNIKGGDLSTGEVIMDYLQPIPVKGTGYHRYAFVLYKQEGPLDFSSLKKPSPCLNLPDRTFKSFDFYKQFENDITPAGLSFFQSKWDPSLTDFFHNVLHMKQPLFEYIAPPVYHKNQEMFPDHEPFNLYLDRYRDPKDLNKEVLTERIKMIHPYKDDPPPPKFPSLILDKKWREGHEYIPSWYKTKLFWIRNRIGRWEGLKSYSKYPDKEFKFNTNRQGKAEHYDALGEPISKETIVYKYDI